MKPDLLVSLEEFKDSISDYAESVRRTRPVAGGDPVRMPFDRSVAERQRRREADVIVVDDAVYTRLLALAKQ